MRLFLPLFPSPLALYLIARPLSLSFFFRQILDYADSPSNFVSNLVATAASYFDMSTAMAEREAEAASISTRDSIFCVANTSGVGFLDSTGKSVTISDPDNRPRDVSYFTFHSSLNPNTVNSRAPNAVHQFEFYLRLLHSSPSSSVNSSLPSASIVTNKSSKTTFNATLSGLSDGQLNKMSATTLRDMFSAQRYFISASANSIISCSLNFSTPDSSTTTVATTSTLKMNMV